MRSVGGNLSVHVPADPRAVVVHALAAAADPHAVRALLLSRELAVIELPASALDTHLDLLAEWAGRLPLACLGADDAAETVLRAAAALRSRVVAVAALGARPAVVLNGLGGLVAPTLLVNPDVNRRTRRRLLSRLPRRSQVIRAPRPEAFALATSFVEMSLIRCPQVGSAGRSPGRLPGRLAVRLGSTAVAVSAGVIALSATSTAADCDPSIQDGGLLTITCAGSSSSVLAIEADGQIVYNGAKIDGATVDQIKLVQVTGSAADDRFVIDERAHKLGTGSGTDYTPIEVAIDLADGTDSFDWLGSAEADHLVVTDAGISIQPGKVDFALSRVEGFAAAAGGGDDVIDASGLTLFKVDLDGGDGNDLLLGGTADDGFVLSLGTDKLDGGSGVDQLKMTSNDALITLTETTIKLTDSVSTYSGLEKLTYRGGVDANVFDVQDAKLDIDAAGGGGLDELKVTSDDALVTVTDSYVSKQLGSLTYADFSKLTLLGGAGDNEFKLDGVKLAEVSVDGGAGLNKIDALSSDSLVTISDTEATLGSTTVLKYAHLAAVKYEDRAVDAGGTITTTTEALDVIIDAGLSGAALKVDSDDSLIAVSDTSVKLLDSTITHKAFTSLRYDGGASDNLLVLQDLKILTDVTAYGGGGTDQVKLLTDAPDVTLSDTAIKLTSALFSINDFALLSYVGTGTGATTLDFSAVKLLGLSLDAGDGLDTLKLASNEALTTLTDTSVKLGTQLVDIKNIEALTFTGGSGDNTLDLQGSKLLKLTADGGSGSDLIKLTSDAALVTLTDSTIKLGDTAVVGHTSFESLSYLGGDGSNTLDLQGIKLLKLSAAGGLGSDSLKVSSDALSVGISDSLISLDGSPIDHKGFETLSYVGTGTGRKDLSVTAKNQVIAADAGPGGGGLKLSSDESLVRLSDTAFKLAVGSVDFKAFDALTFLGGPSANTLSLEGSKYQKLSADGGDGLDTIKLASDDQLITLTDGSIKLANAQLDHKAFETTSFLGGAGDTTLDITGVKLSKLLVDGGAGVDTFKLTTDEPLVTMTDTSLKLSVASLQHKGFEAMSYLGGAAANTFDGSALTSIKLTLNGDGGNDVLKGGAAADLLTGGLGDDTFKGGGGLDTVQEVGDVSFAATNTSLVGLGTDALSSVERLVLSGGLHDNKLDASKFTLGPVVLDGGAGDDTLLGGSLSDVLLGGLNDDTLVGGKGDDWLGGGDGSDFLDGADGTDYGDGGAGTDIGRHLETAVNIEH